MQVFPWDGDFTSSRLIPYYGLNIHIPLKLYVEIPAPQIDGNMTGDFGRQLGHEGGALMNGISAYKRELTEILSPFNRVRIQLEERNTEESPHPARLPP